MSGSESNEEFMRRVMTFGCPTGPLIHVLIFQGLMQFCRQVVAKSAESMDSPMVSGAAWRTTASWLGGELAKRLNEPFPSPEVVSTTEVVTYTGYIARDGVRTQVDFQAKADATKEEKDSAFLDALAQLVELDYLALGSETITN